MKKQPFNIRLLSRVMRVTVVVSFMMLFTACLLTHTGCEVSSADASINIYPSAATVGHVGHAIVLTADGGYVYTWSLENKDWGTLNTYTGNQVIYTSRYQPAGTDVTQVVRVSSRFSDNENINPAGDGTSTNTPSGTSVTHTAEAYITHIATSATPSANGL